MKRKFSMRSREVLVDFKSVPTEQEWKEIFAQSKETPKCTDQCTQGYEFGAKRYDGSLGKCIYCGYQK